MSMSFYPGRSLSYTAQLIGRCQRGEISLRECTRLFINDTPGLSHNEITYDAIGREFQNAMRLFEIPICSGITKKGLRCKHKATSVEGFCSIHKRRD